jgi:hypothetical protein
MKFLTWLIFAGLVVIGYAVWERHSGVAPAKQAATGGTKKEGAWDPGGALPSAGVHNSRIYAAWPFAAQPSPTAGNSGVLSAVAALIKGGLPGIAGTKSVQREDLRIARGIAIGETEAGVIMSCSGWVVRGSVGIYAGDGKGMNILYANLVDAHEQMQYGRLMTVDHGTARQSLYDRGMWTTDSYLYGFVLLKNYPPGSPGRGKGFKVVAAPDGSTIWEGTVVPAYTASFTLAN